MGNPESAPTVRYRLTSERSAPPTAGGERRETTRATLAAAVEAALRGLTVESEKLAHAFADRHDLHFTDFAALVHIMDAEGRGSPLTPGGLGIELGLSSGATTGVIDRLEDKGHVRRDRDDADRRKINLRYADRGAALAMEFFGGLRASRDAVLDQFSDDELQRVLHFMTEMRRILAEHRTRVSGDPGSAG
ncbi:MAG: MarR family transcriptional regulator [Dactylosporangium sp.]|nr:MarR family transcriptional regulator [Dactylosporangium sp.]NNJ63378.1 MarR family transcriptional regulator [Dactylosporangium sp.]